MQIGVVGLGRMGGNISRRLIKSGHRCVVSDVDAKPGAAPGAEGAASLAKAHQLKKFSGFVQDSGEGYEGAGAGTKPDTNRANAAE